MRGNRSVEESGKPKHTTQTEKQRFRHGSEVATQSEDIPNTANTQTDKMANKKSLPYPPTRGSHEGYAYTVRV